MRLRARATEEESGRDHGDHAWRAVSSLLADSRHYLVLNESLPVAVRLSPLHPRCVLVIKVYIYIYIYIYILFVYMYKQRPLQDHSLPGGAESHLDH